MTSIWRAQPLLRTTTLPIRPVSVSRTATQLPLWRFYSQNQTGAKQSSSTRHKEHPGPAPPNVGQNPTNQETTSPSSSSSSSSSSSKKPDPEDEARHKPPYSTTTTEAPSDPEKPEAHYIDTSPSNKAHPTLTTGQQSPNVDEQGHMRSDIPEDVKEHNEAIENRHDRSYNQITDEGEVQKGFR